MLFKCLLVIAACATVTHQEPVKVTVYYESLCPASIRFITQQVYPTWRSFGDKAARYMTLDLVPYGKATQVRNESGWQFSCQHGPTECQGNKLQVCGLHALQRTAAEIAIVQAAAPPSDIKTAVSSEEVDDPAATVPAASTVGTIDMRSGIPDASNMTDVLPVANNQTGAVQRRRRDAVEETTPLPSSTDASVQPSAVVLPSDGVQPSDGVLPSPVATDPLANSNQTGVLTPSVEVTTEVLPTPDPITLIKDAPPYVSDYQMGTLEHNADQVATFIFCVMSVKKPEEAVQACATGSGLTADVTAAIQTCFNGTQGDDILAAYGEKTYAAVPKIRLVPFEGHVPQVTFNGVYSSEDESDAFDDLKAVICRKQDSYSLRNKCSKKRFGLSRPGSGFLVPLLAAGAGALGGYALGSSGKNKQNGYPGSFGNQNQFYPGQGGNQFGSGGGHYPNQNQQYPGQNFGNNPYGSSGGQQYQQGQHYPGQTVPNQHYPGQGGVQQYPGQSGAQQYPGQSGVQHYPGQSGVQHYPGQSGVQQYPGQSGAQQYPGQSGVQQYPGQSGAQQYPGQSGSQQYPGQGGVQQYPGQGGSHQMPPAQNQPYPGQTAPNAPYASSGVQKQANPGQTGLSGIQQLSYPGSQNANQNLPGQTAPNSYGAGGLAPSAPTMKPPAAGWNAPAPASPAKPQPGWVAPTQSSRTTSKYVQTTQRAVTRPPVTRAPVTRAPVTRAPITRAPVTQPPKSRSKPAPKRRKGKH